MRLHEWSAGLQNVDCAAEGTADAPAEKGLRSYWKSINAESLDGLPGLDSAHASQARFDYVDLKSFAARRDRLPAWFSAEAAAAFAFGTVVGASLLRVLQR
jgi:hypothetical protein